jgi:hypothetical protein
LATLRASRLIEEITMQEHAGAVLGAELEAALIRALRREWDSINFSYFRNRLRAPLMLLSDAPRRLGQWTSLDRTIEISRRLVLSEPWGVVVEVLKHEVAHQYVDEVLAARDETAHGPAFRKVCVDLGIDATAVGLPRNVAPSSDEEARIRQRIAKLLALAESPNQHEAEAAMREAQRLMLKYNIEEAAAGRKKSYGYRHLGQPTGRIQIHQRLLATILDSHFFVEPIWVSVYEPLLGRAGSVIEICGTEANLEMASYVHDFLLTTAERLWREHQRATRTRGNADRRSFLAGVMRGFHEKLDAQSRQQQREGLVWVKDGGLSHFFDQRHPKRQSLRTAAHARASAFTEGQKAGHNIVLHRPVQGGASGGVRLLPARRS